jgi:hypothetical protein
MIDIEVTQRIAEVDKLAYMAGRLLGELRQSMEDLEPFLQLLKEDKKSRLCEWAESTNIGYERFKNLKLLAAHAKRAKTPDKRLLEGLGILPKVARPKPKRRKATDNIVSRVGALSELLAKKKEKHELTELDKELLKPLLKYVS